MRSSLFALLAGSVALASATKDGCTQGDLKELLFSSSCSDLEAISTCLSRADFEQLEQLELCFYDAGCETEYAEVGAKWFVSQCNTDEDDQVDELRRRADATTTTEESTTKAASTTAKTTSKTSSTAAASTSATTTSDSSTSSDSTTSSSTTLSTTTSSTTSSTTTSSSTSSTNTCLATSTVSTSACNYFTTSGTKTSTCFATTTATSSCSAGLICSTDTSGADTCMKRDNTLTTSGLIVTIVFSVGIGAFMIAVIVMYAKQNSKQKKEKAEREALLGKTSMMAHNDVEAVGTYSGRNRGASASEANIPLISEPTGANPQYDYFGRDVGAPGASSSSSPNEHPPTIPPVPKLHQGLGALGQD